MDDMSLFPKVRASQNREPASPEASEPPQRPALNGPGALQARLSRPSGAPQTPTVSAETGNVTSRARRPTVPKFQVAGALTSSTRGVSKSIPRQMLSFGLHVLLVYGLVAATSKSDLQSTSPVAADTSLIFLEEMEQQPEPEVELAVAPPEVPALGFQTINAPLDVPTEIPVPDLDLGGEFDPRNYSGVGVEGGVWNGVEGGTATDLDAFDGPIEASLADERPVRMSGPAPRYPEMLRRAGIEGYVILRFVVDADGQVDEDEVTVIESTHPRFEKPAIQAVTGSRFSPGRVSGKAVATLVQTRVDFTLTAARRSGI